MNGVTDHGPSDHGQAHLDAFGGIRWTIANLPLCQRDKAACLALVAAAP